MLLLTLLQVATTDYSALFKLLETSTITALLGFFLWKLWGKLTEKEVEQKALIDKHDAFREQTQKLVIDLHERSIVSQQATAQSNALQAQSNTQLSQAIGKLSDSVSDQKEQIEYLVANVVPGNRPRPVTNRKGLPTA